MFDSRKLVILIDPGVVSINDLCNSDILNGATIIRYKKAIWGFSNRNKLGPLSFFYLDDMTPRTKEEIIESLKDIPLEHVSNIVSGDISETAYANPTNS